MKDLRYRITGDDLTLEWSIPDSGKSRVGDIAGAGVYRFKTPAGSEICRDCPLEWSLVERIPFESGQMAYREVLERGYGYAYQVTLYDQADREGGKSNRVDFDHE